MDLSPPPSPPPLDLSTPPTSPLDLSPPPPPPSLDPRDATVARVPMSSRVLFRPPSDELKGDGPGAVLLVFLLYLPCCNGFFAMLQQMIFECCNGIFGL